MAKNTVKPALTRKRSKRVVENDAYGAFLRRILKAYARRVASGDIEALRGLVLLPSEVDAITRTAVRGLRDFGYSWAEIGDRLGVSRQAAQMRYADPDEKETLDRRIITGGMAVSVATLVEVFADHHPGIPVASTCPGCGYRYPDGVTDCPTAIVVRPLLYKRRHENPVALERLTPDQYEDLHNSKAARTNQAGHRAYNGPSRRQPGNQSLFDRVW